MPRKVGKHVHLSPAALSGGRNLSFSVKKMVLKSCKFKFVGFLVLLVIVYYITNFIRLDSNFRLFAVGGKNSEAVAKTRQRDDVKKGSCTTELSSRGSSETGIAATRPISKKKKRVTLAQRLKNVPKIKVEAVNCKALFAGDPFEQMTAARYHSKLPERKTHIDYSHLPSNDEECESYLTNREFAKEPADKEEAEFPIAYSILVYKDFQQFEKLVRAIYRPQNYYCIHVDSKSEPDFKSAVKTLANCFPDGKVFVAPTSYDVQWATITVLKPELECMKELWNRFAVEIDTTTKNVDNNNNNDNNNTSGRSGCKKPLWKYFINLTGQEFPLRTNLELVKILKIFNGSNNVEATRDRMHELTRKFYEDNRPPRGLLVWKGSVHVVLAREFVDFVVHHPVSSALLRHLDKVWVPDEHFFSTLNNNPKFGVPGSYTGKNPETDSTRNRFLARFKNWGYPPFGWPCRGRWVRQICNFGVGDLPLLASRDELFANKFDYSFEPLTYDCMEELLYNRTRDEYRRSFYKRKDELMRRKVKEEIEDESLDFVENDDRKDGNPNIYKKLSKSAIARLMRQNKSSLQQQKDANKAAGKYNIDHLIFANKDFYTYGDVNDGQYTGGEEAMKLLNYLTWVRPVAHEPGEVDLDHYREMDFVRNHLHVSQDWVFTEDNGYEEPISAGKAVVTTT